MQVLRDIIVNVSDQCCLCFPPMNWTWHKHWSEMTSGKKSDLLFWTVMSPDQQYLSVCYFLKVIKLQVTQMKDKSGTVPFNEFSKCHVAMATQQQGKGGGFKLHSAGRQDRQSLHTVPGCTLNFVAVMMGKKTMSPRLRCLLTSSCLCNWTGGKVGETHFDGGLCCSWIYLSKIYPFRQPAGRKRSSVPSYVCIPRSNVPDPTAGRHRPLCERWVSAALNLKDPRTNIACPNALLQPFHLTAPPSLLWFLVQARSTACQEKEEKSSLPLNCNISQPQTLLSTPEPKCEFNARQEQETHSMYEQELSSSWLCLLPQVVRPQRKLFHEFEGTENVNFLSNQDHADFDHHYCFLFFQNAV